MIQYVIHHVIDLRNQVSRVNRLRKYTRSFYKFNLILKAINYIFSVFTVLFSDFYGQG